MTLGLTVPQVDKIFAKYYKMTYDNYLKRFESYGMKNCEEHAKEEAYYELKQSFQGFEASLKQLSARGTFPSK